MGTKIKKKRWEGQYLRNPGNGLLLQDGFKKPYCLLPWDGSQLEVRSLMLKVLQTRLSLWRNLRKDPRHTFGDRDRSDTVIRGMSVRMETEGLASSLSHTVDHTASCAL